MDFEKEINECQEIMILRGFTAQSKKTYLYNVKKYFDFLTTIRLNPEKDSAKEYLLYLYNKKYNSNSIRICESCVLFLLKDVLKQDVIYLDVPKPKRKKLLPNVLSKDEIKLIFNSIENKKHKLIVSFYILLELGLVNC